MSQTIHRKKPQNGYYFILLLLCSLVVTSSFSIISYAESELSIIISANSEQVRKADVSISHKPVISSKSLIISLIRFYQKFISPQDLPVCNFTPTCSSFAVESIQTFGFFRGILLASDRLQRCNGMSTTLYELNINTGKFSDPVQVYKEILTK